MDAVSILRSEYPGDKAWDIYLTYFAKDWDTDDNCEYINVCTDKQIAAILTVRFGENATTWFCSPCRALDGRTPKDILENEPLGNRVLKTLLMRMPA
jgi:Protein of unknown function (DUF2384)